MNYQKIVKVLINMKTSLLYLCEKEHVDLSQWLNSLLKCYERHSLYQSQFFMLHKCSS